MTTSVAGVGADYLSDAHQAYVHTYKALLNYYWLTNDTWSVRSSISPQVAVEFTDSNSTTTQREAELIDIPANLVALYTLTQNPKIGASTTLSSNLTLIFPAADTSRAAGHYVTLSPRVGAIQKVPLLGLSAPALKTIGFRGAVRWDHLLSSADAPVNDSLDVPRQDLGGNALQSDLLGGGRLAPNKLRATGMVDFEEKLFGKHLLVSVLGYYESARLYGVGGSTLQLATGPYEVGATSGAREAQPAFGLTAAVAYVPTSELEITLGYENVVDLGSEENNVLYTPRAVFLAALSLSVEALVARLNGEPETEPSFIPF